MKNVSKWIGLSLVATLGPFGIGSFVSGGCSSSAGGSSGVAGSVTRGREAESAVFRIICVDTSGSAEPDLAKYRRFTFALVRELKSEVDAVRVLRFDYEPFEILRQLGHRKEALLGTLAAQLRIPAERSRTRFGKLYERIAELMEVPEAQGRRIEVIIFTDNGNDDASFEMVHLRDSASKKIAAHPRLAKITFWGVKPRLAEEIPAAFSKLPEGVLSVQFNTEAFVRR